MLALFMMSKWLKFVDIIHFFGNLLINRKDHLQLRDFCNKIDHFRVIDTAASQLTKTAITVTAIFIVALGYDLWHYLLGHLGVTEYIYNSPKQKYGKCCMDMCKFLFFSPTTFLNDKAEAKMWISRVSKRRKQQEMCEQYLCKRGTDGSFYFQGVWLSSFNSTANPFVYALLMPSYRKCVRQTFCACVTRKSNSQESGTLQTITSEISVSYHKSHARD